MRVVKQRKRPVRLSEPLRWRGRIESLSQEGMGVASLEAEKDGVLHRRPLFIPFTVPGDEVEASIEQARGKYSFGKLEKVLSPSAARVIPLCPHYGTCGGCDLQHIGYEEQLRQKARIVGFLLAKRGIVPLSPVVVSASAQRTNYRWRSRIALLIADGKVAAGFRKARSHEIVPVRECLIVAPRLKELILLLNKASLVAPYPPGELALEVAAAVGQSGKVSALVPLSTVPQRWRAVVRALFERLYESNRQLLGNLLFEDERGLHVFGQVQEHLTYTAAGCVFAFLPGMFIQSNVPTDGALIAIVLDFLSRQPRKRKPRTEQVILDLYAGIGNFTLPAAKRFGLALGVEGDASCIRLARINATQNAVTNARFVHQPVEKYLDALSRKAGAKGKAADERYLAPDAIVLDPPRTGCTPLVLDGLLRSRAPRIVYVSCNPITLADDLAVLGKAYELKELRALDMFPDISHVETVALLERREE